MQEEVEDQGEKAHDEAGAAALSEVMLETSAAFTSETEPLAGVSLSIQNRAQKKGAVVTILSWLRPLP